MGRTVPRYVEESAGTVGLGVSSTRFVGVKLGSPVDQGASRVTSYVKLLKQKRVVPRDVI